jgi:hypothetical protein
MLLMGGFFYFRITGILTFTDTKKNVLDSFNSSIIKTYWMCLIILLKHLTLHVDNSEQQKWRTFDFPIGKKSETLVLVYNAHPSCKIKNLCKFQRIIHQ